VVLRQKQTTMDAFRGQQLLRFWNHRAIRPAVRMEKSAESTAI
jgi:hypothetical protein